MLTVSHCGAPRWGKRCWAASFQMSSSLAWDVMTSEVGATWPSGGFLEVLHSPVTALWPSPPWGRQAPSTSWGDHGVSPAWPEGRHPASRMSLLSDPVGALVCHFSDSGPLCGAAPLLAPVRGATREQPASGTQVARSALWRARRIRGAARRRGPSRDPVRAGRWRRAPEAPRALLSPDTPSCSSARRREFLSVFWPQASTRQLN